MRAFLDGGGHFAVCGTIAEIHLEDLIPELIFIQISPLSEQLPHGLTGQREPIDTSIHLRQRLMRLAADWHRRVPTRIASNFAAFGTFGIVRGAL